MNEAQKEWFRQRIAAIHTRVTAYDVLRRHGVGLTQGGEDREEQISCPFHGEDKKPSARIYPERPENPSHVWCFVCQESGWDAIGLWRKFNNLTFGQAVGRLEREFGLETPEVPEGLWETPVKVDTERDRFQRYYLACEARLLACKPSYRKLGDMAGYLNVGSILDRTKHRVDNDVWKPERGVLILQALLDRIFTKTAACPDD
jgi:hypothetical protein